MVLPLPHVFCCSFSQQLTGIGVDELVKRGLLDKCKEGPLYWVDTADSQPCIGTGGIAAWQLTVHGECSSSSVASRRVTGCWEKLPAMILPCYPAAIIAC
jgi:hypothetical protein